MITLCRVIDKFYVNPLGANLGSLPLTLLHTIITHLTEVAIDYTPFFRTSEISAKKLQKNNMCNRYEIYTNIILC
jgi:hypothetical protein